MEKRKTNILLELMDDIIIEYPNNKEYIQQELHEKCKREGIPIDIVILFFSKLQNYKHFYKQEYRTAFLS